MTKFSDACRLCMSEVEGMKMRLAELMQFEHDVMKDGLTGQEKYVRDYLHTNLEEVCSYLRIVAERDDARTALGEKVATSLLRSHTLEVTELLPDRPNPFPNGPMVTTQEYEAEKEQEVGEKE